MERNLTSMINDPSSEVNLLNEAGILTVFNSFGSGFRTWGNRNASYPTSTDPTNFINIRRTADIIHESVEYSMLQFIDYPIDNGLNRLDLRISKRFYSHFDWQRSVN